MYKIFTYWSLLLATTHRPAKKVLKYLIRTSIKFFAIMFTAFKPDTNKFPFLLAGSIVDNTYDTKKSDQNEVQHL